MVFTIAESLKEYLMDNNRPGQVTKISAVSTVSLDILIIHNPFILKDGSMHMEMLLRNEKRKAKKDKELLDKAEANEKEVVSLAWHTYLCRHSSSLQQLPVFCRTYHFLIFFTAAR